MGKVTTIYLDDDLYTIIKNKKGEGFNFNAWINNQIREHFTDIDFLNLKKNKMLEEIKRIDDDINLLRQYQKPKKDGLLEEKEIKFLQETIEILKRDVGYLDGRFNLYRNNFLKPISKTEFIKLIEQIKN